MQYCCIENIYHRIKWLRFGVFIALYVLSAAPTVLWGDDAELQRIAITGEARAIGQSSATSHLLWQAVAMGFVRATTWLPVDQAGRVTLVSSIAGALALDDTRVTRPA